MKITLRPYQETDISEIRKLYAQGKRRVLYQLATGGGKTVVFTVITFLSSMRGKRVLIVTDRKELRQQGGRSIRRAGIEYEEVTAKTRHLPNANVCLSMVETLKRRIHKPDYLSFVRSFDLIIIDECHICAFNKLFDALEEKQLVLGVTATPQRTGKMRELKEDYDAMHQGPQICELIANGHLVPSVHYGIPVDTSKVRITAGEYNETDQGAVYKKVYGGAVENWNLRAKGKKTVAFCATVENSIELCAEFNSHGISAVHVDGTTPEDDRDEIFRDFDAGVYLVLCNCGIATKGWDCPSVECVILYRMTTSLVLYLQMIGRGSRTFPGKNVFIILDFGGNYRHGFYDTPRLWSLSNPKKRRSKKDGEFPVKKCPKCESLLPVGVRECKYCGYIYEPTKKEKVFAILREMTPSEITRYAANASIDEMETIREVKGYNVGWALHQLKTMADFLAYEALKGYGKGWALINGNRYLGVNGTWVDWYEFGEITKVEDVA
ncbi:MAG: DEAD/DEAH box helicase [Desulfobulbaceae bacterium]|nr:DEAD/DEAH box helicase [Desulfobulbaceae bacterium]